ncbi:MAG: Gfo/Idh/MocA family oxidoreductase [Bryobacterales bacterium]|nr:Gfo/Idh/MocA family oxidoreductase [Bryobacterales bacterium]
MGIKVGVAGCGNWGRNLVRNFSQLGALGAICDESPAVLKKQAAALSGVRTFTSFERLLESDEPAVVIATPAAMHYTQAKEALLAGKHVFVEKPLALRYYQGLELVELAESRKRILMVGHILEYHPAVALLRRLACAGELGKLWYIYSNRLNLGKVRQAENALWSFAPHDIAVITSLVGSEPSLVASLGGTYLQGGIEDVTMTNLVYEGPVRAHIFVSWLHPYKEQKLVVVGDRKMAVFDDTARDGKLKIYDKGIEWNAGLPVPRQTAESVLFFEPTEPLEIECAHFLSSVREGTQPLTDGRSALRVLRVLEASQMSLRNGGAPVPLQDVATRVAAA